MTQHIARTSKGPIEYRFEGSGPTIVVLNDGPCSRETRLSHEKLAEHGSSVLTPSCPGYDAAPSEVGKTAQAAADALAALLDTLQISGCEVYEVPSDTHLIWIGNSAKDVSKKRLTFIWQAIVVGRKVVWELNTSPLIRYWLYLKKPHRGWPSL